MSVKPLFQSIFILYFTVHIFSIKCFQTSLFLDVDPFSWPSYFCIYFCRHFGTTWSVDSTANLVSKMARKQTPSSCLQSFKLASSLLAQMEQWKQQECRPAQFLSFEFNVQLWLSGMSRFECWVILRFGNHCSCCLPGEYIKDAIPMFFSDSPRDFKRFNNQSSSILYVHGF